MSESHEGTKLSRTFAGTATLKLAEIHASDIFYTPIEERFERISRLATRALDVPIAAITLLHPEKQWFKSVVGWDISELPLQESFCARIVDDGRVCIVSDATRDRRFSDHPLVVGRPQFRFYASYPLYDEALELTGTFCVLDTVPRELTDADCDSLTDLGQLAQRELSANRLAEAQSELVAKLSASRREAMFDPLTRVWNRRGAKALLESSLLKAREHSQGIGICLLDLDNFKRVNDLHGHQTGDHVLRQVAAALVSCLRPSDVVCRFGGDEFLIILPGAEDIQASIIAERIRRSIADVPIRTREGAVPISVSIGYKVIEHADQAELDDMIADADRALMACKREGRNIIRFAS